MREARPTRAVIDLDALRANYAEAARRAAGCDVIAVVKADAYGHGAVPVAQALCAAGCPRLAVVTVAEAAELRDAGIGAPIHVLGGVHDADEADAAVAFALTPVVHHAAHVEWLSAVARSRDARPPVEIEVDTGMHRMGAPPEAVADLAEAVAGSPLHLDGVFTHFARADEPDPAPTLAQLESFRDVLGAIRERGVDPGRVHAANSAGLLAGDAVASALPEVDAARPGLMLYGANPSPHVAVSLRPVMTLRARVVYVRPVRAGEGVGYGAEFRAEKDTRVATLPLGYADGIPVSLGGRGQVLLGGRRLPLVGRVSMDYVAVDVGDAPVAVGDEAVLFGSDAAGSLPVEEVAAAAGTLAYELLVRVGARVPREIRG